MNVEVRAFGPLRNAIGSSSYHCTLESEATVGDLLDVLRAEFDDIGSFLGSETDSPPDSVIVTVNKTNVRNIEGLESSLSDGDVVRLSPPIHGG